MKRIRLRVRTSSLPPEEGDRVRLTWRRSMVGKILKKGPEVSEVRWDDRTFNDIFIPNEQLEHE